MRNYILGVLLAIISLNTIAQEKRNFKIHTIAFYNVENLFDTINDINKNDEASPIMEIKFNRSEIYKKKVKNMASVIADIGSDLVNKSPSIVGLSEVENRNVIEDLLNNEHLLNKNYDIVHYDSPDERGIDVGLIYNKNVFKVSSTKSHELIIYDNKSSKRNYTRDQLVVSGLLDNELIHIIVNHWPSRSGGEERSRAGRMAAAELNKKIIDSGYKTFNSMEEAKDFPVAAKIFENADVASIFIMAEAEGVFISVTKTTEANWNDLKNKIVASINAVL